MIWDFLWQAMLLVLDLLRNLDVTLARWADLYGVWLYVILFAIIFCETGLVVTPFLPGDSLLFVAGGIAGLAGGALNVHTLVLVLVVAAILGDATNYTIGRYAGAQLSAKYPRLIKPENLAETHRFFEKHGGKTIILARFLPFVRTFAPFVAGMSKMNHSLFLRYNVIGAVIWVASLCYLGYVLGQNEWVKLHLEKIIILMIVVPGLPAVWKVLKSYLAKKQAAKKNNSPSI